ncbi:MAG: NAD-binding protein [Chloroflexota bacterium]
MGRTITCARAAWFSYVVITDDRHETVRLRDRGVTTLFGDAANQELLEHARIGEARILIVAIRDEHATPPGSSTGPARSRRACPWSCAPTTRASATRSWRWAATSRRSSASWRWRSR